MLILVKEKLWERFQFRFRNIKVNASFKLAVFDLPSYPIIQISNKSVLTVLTNISHHISKKPRKHNKFYWNQHNIICQTLFLLNLLFYIYLNNIYIFALLLNCYWKLLNYTVYHNSLSSEILSIKLNFSLGRINYKNTHHLESFRISIFNWVPDYWKPKVSYE